MSNFVAKQLFKVSFYPLLFLGICWLIFYLNGRYLLYLNEFGTSPRTLVGLRGILFSPFLHADLDHIASNSIPVLVLGMLTFYFYKPIAKQALLWIWLIAGVWLWVGGRNNIEGSFHHIGASGLIYGMAFFLFFSGVLRKHKPLMVVSALVLFLYGSITWGLFPLKNEISWEAHLFGAIAGLMVAYNFKKEGPQRKTYEWEEEDDDDNDGEWNKEVENEAEQNTGPNFNIRYHYIPKTEEDNEENKPKE
jgi:membrane associated rhomboid family serine protease